MKHVLGVLFIVTSLFMSTTLRADDSAFCSERNGPRSIQQILLSNENQLAFRNYGGLLNGGVCWWHSRFTRNAAYIARFNPEGERLSDKAYRSIIKKIRKATKIVEIPGYANLREFSRDFEADIQRVLEDWQKVDGFLRFAWVRGLRGGTSMSASKLEQNMDALYERVKKGEAVYQMLQLPGVEAHAWLVLDMESTDRGYRMTVLDSNTGIDHDYYERGSTGMSYMGYAMTPYTSQTGEEAKLRRILAKKCNLPAVPASNKGKASDVVNDHL